MWHLMKVQTEMKSEGQFQEWTKGDIAVVVMTWFWKRVDRIAWLLSRLEHLQGI